MATHTVVRYGSTTEILARRTGCKDFFPRRTLFRSCLRHRQAGEWRPDSSQCSDPRQPAAYATARDTLTNNLAPFCRTARIIAPEAPPEHRMPARAGVHHHLRC